eukprot:CAMPEP_0173123282 /NCGR_PEP_ID=MMETSP1102-20130122/54828_1 /TAXON_ID=49646 /ORGANISM="Geminigera sp., Strain Caron Lab Isolate" /LENGTH=88 /DNA_ID=CAMNT_0014031129 /DNA_START=18 /DNA_END=281 /DNA_ORIENTATION=-
MSDRAQHPLAQVLGADEARAQALAESPMVALSQSRDGRTSYAKVKFKIAPQFKPAPPIQTCPVLGVFARVPHCLDKLSQVDMDTMIRG